MMYFVPLLFALCVYAAVPSIVAAVSAGLLAWAYLMLGGVKQSSAQRRRIAAELAYRTLSVKAMVVNGRMDAITYNVHSINTPDDPENSILRSRLRDAAGRGSDGLHAAARRVRRAVGRDPVELHKLMTGLVIQLSSQPASRIQGSESYRLADEVQKTLMEIGSIWGIGPSTLREILSTMRIQPTQSLAFAS